jgi:hypothetical protein
MWWPVGCFAFGLHDVLYKHISNRREHVTLITLRASDGSSKNALTKQSALDISMFAAARSPNHEAH